jgi:hypothetical protein
VFTRDLVLNVLPHALICMLLLLLLLLIQLREQR